MTNGVRWRAQNSSCKRLEISKRFVSSSILCSIRLCVCVCLHFVASHIQNRLRCLIQMNLQAVSSYRDCLRLSHSTLSIGWKSTHGSCTRRVHSAALRSLASQCNMLQQRSSLSPSLRVFTDLSLLYSLGGGLAVCSSIIIGTGHINARN